VIQSWLQNLKNCDTTEYNQHQLQHDQSQQSKRNTDLQSLPLHQKRPKHWYYCSKTLQPHIRTQGKYTTLKLMIFQLENRAAAHQRRQKKCFSKFQRQHHSLTNRTTRNTCLTKAYVQNLTPPSILATMLHIPQIDSLQSKVKQLEYSSSNKRLLAIYMPKRKNVITKHNQLERHPTCYHKLSLTHALIQNFSQYVMCKLIKRYPANTKSQASKDETNRQDTKKRSSETNTQNNKKESKYTHLRLSIKVKSFCSIQYKSSPIVGKDHRHEGNKSSSICPYRTHMLQHTQKTSPNVKISKYRANQLQKEPDRHSTTTNITRHNPQRPTPSPRIQSKTLVCNLLTFKFLLQNNRMSYKQLNFETNEQDQEMEEVNPSSRLKRSPTAHVANSLKKNRGEMSEPGNKYNAQPWQYRLWFGFHIMDGQAKLAGKQPYEATPLQKLMDAGLQEEEANELQTAKISFPRIYQKEWPQT
jgi:hypothetical protein